MALAGEKVVGTGEKLLPEAMLNKPDLKKNTGVL